MNMSLGHKEFVDKASLYLKELFPSATDVSFEEFGSSLAIENPPNAVVVVLSYKDASNLEGVQGLFSKKLKSIYLHPETGELLAIKNKLI